jgi:hypothetical protein
VEGCLTRSRRRLTLAKLLAVFPIELLLNVLVTRQGLPFIATVAMLLSGGWFHALAPGPTGV